MKKIKHIFLCLILCIALSGCAKCISTETKTVQVKVVDEYHRGAYITPMRVGKVTTMITYPAVYRITVEYNGYKYSVSGSDTYNKYKDKIGEYANATLETKVYDDESVKHNIISIE